MKNIYILSNTLKVFRKELRRDLTNQGGLEMDNESSKILAKELSELRQKR